MLDWKQFQLGLFIVLFTATIVVLARALFVPVQRNAPSEQEAALSSWTKIMTGKEGVLSEGAYTPGS